MPVNKDKLGMTMESSFEKIIDRKKLNLSMSFINNPSKGLKTKILHNKKV
jgi:hypothetical protein